MNSTIVNQNLNKFKALLLNSKLIISKECLKVLESEFILTMIHRTRLKHKMNWNLLLEPIFDKFNISDDKFFRIVDININDIIFTFYCDNDFNQILKHEIGIKEMKYYNEFRESLMQSPESLLSEGYNEEIHLLFINGEMYRPVINNQYTHDLNTKKELYGVWKTENFCFDFSKNYFSKTIQNVKYLGSWHILNNLMLIRYNKNIELYKICRFSNTLLSIENIDNGEKLEFTKSNKYYLSYIQNELQEYLEFDILIQLEALGNNKKVLRKELLNNYLFNNLEIIRLLIKHTEPIDKNKFKAKIAIINLANFMEESNSIEMDTTIIDDLFLILEDNNLLKKEDELYSKTDFFPKTIYNPLKSTSEGFPETILLVKNSSSI